MSEEIKMESKRKMNKKLLVGVAIIAALIVVATFSVFAPKVIEAKRIEKQLNLGEKYLTELNYEQAEAAYLAVIEIDPRNVDAYLGLAEVYIAQGEYEKAEEILKSALEKLGEDAEDSVCEIQKKLERLEQVWKQEEVAETLVPTATSIPVPTATSTPISEIEEYGDVQGLFQCRENIDGTVTITAILDTNIVELVVPEEIKGKRVTRIVETALAKCKNLETLYISASIETLGWGNSYDPCFVWSDNVESNLREINVAEENTAYTSINGVLYTKDMKQLVYVPNAYEGNLTVPETVTNIHTGALQDCRKLTEITFLASEFFSIYGEMFKGCVSLKAINVSETNETYCSIEGVLYEEWGRKRGERYQLVKVPAQSSKVCFEVNEIVTNIDSDAFYDCSLIETIKLHRNVSMNGMSILSEFSNETAESDNYLEISECINLKEILVEEGNEEVRSIDGILYSADGTELLHVPIAYEKANIVVPEGIKRISINAFYNCRQLQSVVFPESLVVIWDNAFVGCESLEEIRIPRNVKYIGNYAFERCNNLSNVEIENPMMELGENVFSGCKENLKMIELVEQEIETYEGLFTWCRSVDGDTVWISDILFYFYDEVYQLQSIVLPNVIEGKKSNWNF